MTIPLNRLVAFVGPYTSVLAGGIASWLVAKVNLLGLPGLDENNLKTAIAGGLTWLLVAGLSWAGHSKWLTGHHIQLQGDASVEAAATSGAATPAPVDAGTAGNGFHPDDVGAIAVPDEELPTDDEELAAPPPPVAVTPVE